MTTDCAYIEVHVNQWDDDVAVDIYEYATEDGSADSAGRIYRAAYDYPSEDAARKAIADNTVQWDDTAFWG